MSGFTDFFQPTPQQPPTPFQPPGYDLLRQLLMQKIFSLQANPYGLSGQTAQNPQSFLGNQLNTSTPFFGGQNAGYSGQPVQDVFGAAFGGSSGGTPTGGVNPAWAQPGGARTPMAVPPRPTAPAGGAHMDGRRVPILQRHFDAYSGGTPAPYTMGNMPYADVMSRGLPWLMHHFGNQPFTGSQAPTAFGQTYTGAQHEFGGNPMIANAFQQGGGSPTDLAHWLIQGANWRSGYNQTPQAQHNLQSGMDVFGNPIHNLGHSTAGHSANYGNPAITQAGHAGVAPPVPHEAVQNAGGGGITPPRPTEGQNNASGVSGHVPIPINERPT